MELSAEVLRKKSNIGTHFGIKWSLFVLIAFQSTLYIVFITMSNVFCNYNI